MPRLAKDRSLDLKHGRVRVPFSARIRAPSRLCCPSAAQIWERLMKLPLDPAVTMRRMALSSRRCSFTIPPACMRVLERRRKMVCSAVFATLGGTSPETSSWISSQRRVAF